MAGSPTIAGLRAGLDDAWLTPVVGASGAIFGLFGALLVLNRHLGRSSAAMYATIAINAAFGFFYPGISWQAHLGGLVTGVICAGVIVAFRRQGVRHLVWAALGAVLVLLVAVTVGEVPHRPRGHPRAQHLRVTGPCTWSASPARRPSAR